MEVWILIGGAALIINTLYWLFLLIGIRRVPDHSVDALNEEPTTIIVVCHNAIDHIKRNVGRWLSQTGRLHEVLIMDDGSIDNTYQWMEDYVKDHSSLHYRYHQKTQPGKKEALAVALDQTSTKWALLTDADCLPASDHWLDQAVAQAKNQDSEVLLMYAPFFKKSGWLNRLVRFENVLTALQYFSWWVIGRPYMSVGRNVLYQQNVYHQFSSKIDTSIASGDDDLFFQKISRNHRIGATLSPDTFVYSNGPNRWIDWVNQKARHSTTSWQYPLFFKVNLGVFAFSQILVSAVFFTCIFSYHPWMLSLLVLRWMMFIFLGKKSFKKLDQDDLYPYWIILDIILGMFLLILSGFSFFKNSKKW